MNSKGSTLSQFTVAAKWGKIWVPTGISSTHEFYTHLSGTASGSASINQVNQWVYPSFVCENCNYEDSEMVTYPVQSCFLQLIFGHS